MIDQLTLTYFLGGPLGFPSGFFSSGFFSSGFLANPSPIPNVFFSAGGGATKAFEDACCCCAGSYVVSAFCSYFLPPSFNIGAVFYYFFSSVPTCFRPHVSLGLSAAGWVSPVVFFPKLRVGAYGFAGTTSVSATLLTPLKVHVVLVPSL